MKNIWQKIIWSKNNKINSLLAFGIFGLMVLGCTCTKDFKFGDSNSSENTQNTSKPNDNRDKTTLPIDKNKEKSTSKEDLPLDKDGFDILNPEKAQALIKNTFADFADGVEEEDFSTFHSHGSKLFQNEFTPDKLSTLFQQYIDKKKQVVPILRQTNDRDAIITESKIRIESGNKFFVITGTFPTSPSVTSFELKYLNEAGVWRIVNFKTSMK